VKRVRIALPAVAAVAEAAAPDIGYPFAGWLGIGTLLRREIDTTDYAGNILTFGIRHLVTQEFYTPPPGLEWSINVEAYGDVVAADVEVLYASSPPSMWYVFLPPSLSGASGFVVIEITGTVGATTVVGPFALALIFSPGGA
jgi:hypothetical protein